ncbi:TetR/AcrR family transcriptional regulator [Amycolatopsis sp. cg5]|uniref:TetR/AcrR family transcriptional regulator n=1 Tax=Amycolatopsis sp. cg5 TaxID=3238802 RepID=UPI00352596C7
MRADALRNYERLLSEAKLAFRSHGVEASLEDIARNAGVGIGTLYRHFPTREALIETLLRDRFDSQAAAARELLGHPSPFEALTTWLLGLGKTSSEYKGLPEAMAAAIDQPGSPLYVSCHEMQAAASQLVDRARESGELRAGATTRELLLLTHAVVWASEHHPSDDGMDRLFALVVTGLRAS